MSIFPRYAVAFTAAVLCTSLLASIFSTQSVISSLQEVGAVVPFATRVSMTLVDFKIFEILIAVVAACFLIGFIIAALCNRFIINNRHAWFVLAGACALVCTLLLMNWFLQLMPIAGARSLFGLAFQAVAGAIGGFVFSKITATTNTTH